MLVNAANFDSKINNIKSKISKNEVIYFSPLFDIQKPNIYNIPIGKSITSVKPSNVNLIEQLNDRM